MSDRDSGATPHPNLASFLCGGFAAAGEPVTVSPVWQVNIGLSFQLSAFILLPRETKAIATRTRQSARPIGAARREGKERRDEERLRCHGEGSFLFSCTPAGQTSFQTCGACHQLAMHEQSGAQAGSSGLCQTGFVRGLAVMRNTSDFCGRMETGH